MKLFLDTANADAIRDAIGYGIVAGVVTDPSSIARESRVLEEVLTDITGIVPDGIVFGQVISPDHEKMVEEAAELVKISKNLEIQIPMCAEGLKAIKILKAKGIRTSCTLIYSAGQALLAARAGASYVSACAGGQDNAAGPDLIGDIARIFTLHGIDCEIIAADIRSPVQVTACARLGAHIAAVPPAVIRQMIAHPQTDSSLEQFARDWEELLERL